MQWFNDRMGTFKIYIIYIYMEKDWWPASKLSHPTLACGPIMGIPQASIGWFISWKIRSYKWMRTGGTPILGNLHIMIYNIIYNITIGTLYRYYVVMTYHYVHQSSALCVIIPTTVIVVDAVGKINCRTMHRTESNVGLIEPAVFLNRDRSHHRKYTGRIYTGVILG